VKVDRYFPRLTHFLQIGLLILVLFLLAGCKMPGKDLVVSEIDVTQALQTVEARLTQAVAQTTTQTTSPEPGEPTISATPTPTLPPEITSTNTLTENPIVSTNTPVPAEGCDQAAAGYPKIDITIDDDTEMAPGQAFTKIWRVVNVGTCTWTTDYDVVFFSGELMGAPSSLALNTTVAKDQSVDLAIDMVAPASPGTYQGNWKLRNAAGILFGIGPGSESPFWVRIKVVSATTATSTPTPTPTPTVAVQASGSVQLAINDTLDLDSLQVNGSGPDLRYRTTLIDPRQELHPLVGVTISVYGGSQPGLANCQAATLGSVPIILDNLSTGTYLCYRTDLGLPGWARFDGFETNTGALILQILTWKLP
jgi:hypothetical protein